MCEYVSVCECVCELRLLGGIPALGWVLLSQYFLVSEKGCVQGRAAGAEPGSFQYVNCGVTQGLDHCGKAIEIQTHQLRPSAWQLKSPCSGEEYWFRSGEPPMSL